MSWVGLVLFYGIAKGVRDVIKKKALTKNSVMEILFVYTLLTFICCIPEVPEVMGLPFNYYFLIAIKSIVIFIAWILSFKALDNLPISLYGVIDLSRILFSTLFGIVVLNEIPSFCGQIGFVLVIIGLLFLKAYPMIKNKTNEKVPAKFIVMTLVSCILNATSGCLDKIYMKDVNSSQLQFWYMLYLVLLYGGYFVIKKLPISKSVWKNGFIYLLSIIFFLGDKALFIANANPDSKVIIMTLLKQSACIISIVSGKIVFKEKNIGYKLISALIIIIGIVLSVI